MVRGLVAGGAVVPGRLNINIKGKLENTIQCNQH